MVGIYKVTNKKSGKSYIGQSIHIKERWRQHVEASKKDIIDSEFHSDLKKYGKSNFDFQVLEECDVCELDERECYYIDKFDTLENGYNAVAGLEYNPRKREEMDSVSLLEVLNDVGSVYTASKKMDMSISTLYGWIREHDIIKETIEYNYDGEYKDLLNYLSKHPKIEVPKKIMKDERTERDEVFVYSIIKGIIEKEGCFTKPNKTLEMITGFDSRNINRILARLYRHGYINYKYVKTNLRGRQRIIYLEDKPSKAEIEKAVQTRWNEKIIWLQKE